MKRTTEHPEVENMKNICDVSPKTKMTKDVCDRVQKKNPPHSKNHKNK
jgi:hypothetical protein